MLGRARTPCSMLGIEHPLGRARFETCANPARLCNILKSANYSPSALAILHDFLNEHHVYKGRLRPTVASVVWIPWIFLSWFCLVLWFRVFSAA